MGRNNGSTTTTRYYWLLEFGERKTVLAVPNEEAMKEINTIIELAKEQGIPITLEKASPIDWLDTH